MTLYKVVNGSTVIRADNRWTAWEYAKSILNIIDPVLVRVKGY